MEALLNVSDISTHHDVKGLRRLHDSVEAHVRGLRMLGVPPDISPHKQVTSGDKANRQSSYYRREPGPRSGDEGI